MSIEIKEFGMKEIFAIILLLSIAVYARGVSVYEVQFTDDPFGDSPLINQVVTVSGIVSATNWYISGSDSNFCITDAEGGAWRGIFVYNFDYSVELGDEVEVTALVQEYYGFTELSNVENVVILSSGNAVPAPVVISTSELSGTEAYEGVLVQVNNVIVTQGLDNYGQAYISDGSGNCQTDDAMFNYNPVVGEEYAAIIGIVDYSFDEFGLNPRCSEDLGYTIEPGFITGTVCLAGGTGEVSDVTIMAGDYSINPGANGFYMLEVSPGTYDVSAVLAGYFTGTIEDVVVEEGANVTGIDFELMPIGDTTIYDVQYTAEISGDSPLAGQEVTISGIVTATGFGGYENFFLSSPDGGAWNGIYIYQSDYEVEEGDAVTLTGTVGEYYGFTEISYLTELIIESSGNPVPVPVDITTSELSSSEAYESVLVRVNNVEVTIAPNEYGEAYIDDNSGACQLDDGFVFNPQLMVGVEFLSITGVVDYGYDQYGLQPRYMEDFDDGTQIPQVSIYDIQFTEDISGDSPYLGQTVEVNGIVTGFGYNNSNYFFISSPTGGAWNGLYIYQFDYEVAIGDNVTIIGAINEYFNFTELGFVQSLVVNSSGNTLPDPVELTTAELASSEAYESVLVKVNDVAVTSEVNEYGEAYIDDGSGACQLDDGFFTNPEVVLGAEFVSITGLVDYSFYEYGLQPRNMEDFDDGTQILEASIYDIQFTEDPSGDSPYLGQIVEVNGIVTGFGYNNNNYFFISSPAGGAWNGLYIYQFDYEVAVGDDVTITGEINEYYNFTELGFVESLVVNSSGNTLPDPVELTTAELASSEAYESVLVKVNDVAVTSDVSEYGEAYIDDGSGVCQIDDGFFANPEVLLGAEFVSITGLVDYSFYEYGLHPRNLEDFVTGVPWLYGDVTADEMIDAFDAANILQYAVGLNPSGATLPWTWELIAGDVDGNEATEAYDASLILQYSVGLLDIFPVEEGRTGAPFAQLVFCLQNGELTARAVGELYSAVIKINSADIQIDFPQFSTELLWAVNLTEKQIAFASCSQLSGKILNIPYQQNSADHCILIEATVNGCQQQPVIMENHNSELANLVLEIFPNPFNPVTSIKLNVNAENTPVKVDIYNVKGQLINTLFNGSLNAGIHDLKWHGTDENGNTAGSGVYFYKAQIGSQISSGKMLMLK
ncbi:MAG: T9SS type A sorting domain-containing protein [Candidatus Cloacimonetes bacterium]|nr:T9SS type A sorting domain-containing protein [Candidatus Cloacimonadota bacterium]